MYLFKDLDVAHCDREEKANGCWSGLASPMGSLATDAQLAAELWVRKLKEELRLEKCGIHYSASLGVGWQGGRTE